MRAGRLRHQLLLQAKAEASPSQDEYGAPQFSWVTQATVWAGIEPLSGKEWLAQGQQVSESVVRIVIRYYPGVTPAWRAVHMSDDSPQVPTYYNIVDVLNENERDRMMTLMCREGVSDDES